MKQLLPQEMERTLISKWERRNRVIEKKSHHHEETVVELEATKKQHTESTDIVSTGLIRILTDDQLFALKSLFVPDDKIMKLSLLTASKILIACDLKVSTTSIPNLRQLRNPLQVPPKNPLYKSTTILYAIYYWRQAALH